MVAFSCHVPMGTPLLFAVRRGPVWLWVYFDHCYPPERGYGYVAASRFRTMAGLFHYGRIRRTDWLPVGLEKAIEQVSRGYSSDESNEFDEELRELDSAYDSDEDCVGASLLAGGASASDMPSSLLATLCGED